MNQQRMVVYSATPDSLLLYVKKIWRYKHLIYTFAYQDVRMQYAQTYFSLFWIVIKPLMVLAVFAFVFDNLFRIPTLVSSYPLFAFTGLIMWNNFSFMVNNGGGVVSANHGIARKMYFPRIILVFSKTLSGIIELVISICLVFILVLIYRQPIHLQVIALPVFIALNILLGTGIAIWLNALSIKHRDINHFVPQLVGFLIWLTPVFYPATMIPKQVSFLIYLNPVAGIIQGCRWAILGDTFPSIYYLPGFALCIIGALVGVVFFASQEDIIADNA